MNYTDEEIEMLARFCDAATPNTHDNWPDIVRESILLGEDDDTDLMIRSAARLMREARRQGAEEMREKAAAVAEVSDINLPMRAFIAKEIRALPLPGDPNVSS